MTWNRKWRQNLREDGRRRSDRNVSHRRKEKLMSDFSYDMLDLLAKYGNDTRAALEGEKDPKCLYAFSPLRENLFEWVEFEKTDRILQIGSDYGSFTGLLAKRAGEVVVVDSHDENLEVNRLRHGDNGNVRYVCGQILHQPAGGYREYRPTDPAAGSADEIMVRPFDYVIMAGLFEQYKKEDAPALLDAAAGFLKTGGMLFAAAENEAGVRYWMGADAFEVSFLEKEYRDLLGTLTEKYGGSVTMYYPVPDYRYAAVIYSDDYLPAPGEVSNISARLDGPGIRLGSEEEAMVKACRNGAFPKFANSFLGVFKRG